MRISSFFLPFFTVLAGCAGYYLRLTELMNVFDPRTGLPERGADITLALIVLSAVCLFLILIFSIIVSLRNKAPHGFENAFGTDPFSYPLAFSLIGAAWLGATVKYYLDTNTSEVVLTTELYFSILSALAAISIVFFSIEMYQDPRRKSTFALSIVPTIFMCFWLILMYRQNASNPILLRYAYYFLAIISSALSFYFTSGFVYNKPAPGKAIFFYCAAIYFCFVTLADDHDATIKIIIAAIVATNVMHSSMLVRNLRRKDS